jgi:hypothetical protein
MTALLGVALDRVDLAVGALRHHIADVVDVVEALAAVPVEEDDRAGLGRAAPLAVGLEPLGVGDGPGILADGGGGLGAAVAGDPGDEHVAPAGVQIGLAAATVTVDGLLSPGVLEYHWENLVWPEPFS